MPVPMSSTMGASPGAWTTTHDVLPPMPCTLDEQHGVDPRTPKKVTCTPRPVIWRTVLTRSCLDYDDRHNGPCQSGDDPRRGQGSAWSVRPARRGKRTTPSTSSTSPSAISAATSRATRAG